MGYSLLFKRSFGDNENPFVYVQTDAMGNIVAEPWDNGLEHRVTFTGISVMYKPKGQGKFTQSYLVNDEKYDLYVTESRLIFKLQSLKKKLKFKGSLVDYAVDAMFKKAEDKAVEGLGILGHLRYEWIASIMYFEKTGWKNNNMLRFTYYDRDSTLWQVTVTFPNDMDVRFLANEILHMACRYREKTICEKDEKLQTFIAKYKTEDILPAADPRNNFSFATFPNVKMAAFGAKERPEI